MSIIIHVAGFVTLIIWDLAAGSMDGLAAPVGLDAAIRIAAIILIAVLLAVLSVWIVSAVIYKLDDSHFGPGGAIRWAVTGVVYALMWQALKRLVFFNKFARDLLQLVVIGLSYWLVFRFLPLAQKVIHRSTAYQAQE